MDIEHEESLTDCSRRIAAVERLVLETRDNIAAKSDGRDKEISILAGALSTERERASGYAFRIAALEGIKPLGISTVLVTAAAVIGVIAIVGGSFLNLMQKLDDKDTEYLMALEASDRRDIIYMDTRNRELAVELRQADKESWIRQDETRQKIAAVEARQLFLLDMIDGVRIKGMEAK